jgi:hypothetical protein
MAKNPRRIMNAPEMMVMSQICVTVKEPVMMYKIPRPQRKRNMLKLRVMTLRKWARALSGLDAMKRPSNMMMNSDNITTKTVITME